MNNWVNGQLHEAFILYKSSIKRLAFALQFATYINILPFSNSRVSGEHFSSSVPSNLSESENIISPCYLIFQTRQLMTFQYA